MESEGLLADHQATDGIVAEKNTVKEKQLNGEESKDEENAADRVVLRESVMDCSKMSSLTSEKEETIEEVVDSFSEVVEVSPTEEATNKTFQMIKDDENGELEVPLETAEASPVESNHANSAMETREIEAKLEDHKEVGREVEQQIPTDSVSAKITDDMEVGREVEAEVEQQVLSDSSIAAPDVEKQILGVEELEEEQIQPEETEDVNAEKTEVVETETNHVALSVLTADEIGNTEDQIVDDEKEAAIEVQEQALSDSSTSTLTNSDGNQEVTTKAEKDAATETIDVASIVVTADEVEIEVEKQFPSDSGGTTSASTLAFVTAAEVGEAEAEIEDDEKAVTEVQEQIPIGFDTQETKRPESELIDDDQEVLKEAKKQISSEESSDVGAKIDDGKTAVEPVVEQQFPSDSGCPTSVAVVAERTGEIEAEYANDNKEVKTEAEKQVATETNDVTKLVDDNQEAVVNAEEQVLIESSNKEIDAEVRKLEVNQGHEADAANNNGLVLAEEETDNATVDGALNNSNVTELKTINRVQEDTGTDHTSAVQTAGEISQPEVEVDTNKIDSASFAELPTREEKPNVSAESVDMKDNISEDKTSMDKSNVEEAKGPANDERDREINDHSQTDEKDIDIEMSKEDKITETNDEFEGKKSSEGIGIAQGEKEDIFKVGKVILDEDSKHSYAPDIADSSNKIEKSEFAKEKHEDSENDSTITDETTKSAGENADALSNLSVENKTSEDQEEKESKDESVNRDYVAAPKDIDVKEDIATAVSAFVDAENKKESEKTIDESLSPKSADPVKLEEVPRESAPAKSSPRRSNNIISKVKHQIVKAKKAIMGKSPSSKDMSPKSKEVK